ncbi:Ig-like domain-containing protein [Staphylococcus epidermidis]|uniref:Ig-like domain-containing protein n=1 Tax=Staphylococcus epidermidis TaxID=1282 RepID=UPI001C405E1C|nr:Ig-like domain-containing protein [Staphylococcus epidermidis]
MALTLLVYRGGEVIKRQPAAERGRTTVTIDGLESNTTYDEGDFKLAWTDGNLESDKVNVPEFKTNKVGVTNITSTPDTVSLTVGETQQINTVVTPDGANDKSVTYSTNNQPVATVTQDGLITAESSGQATITVKSNDDPTVTSKVRVTVKDKPAEEQPSTDDTPSTEQPDTDDTTSTEQPNEPSEDPNAGAEGTSDAETQ